MPPSHAAIRLFRVHLLTSLAVAFATRTASAQIASTVRIPFSTIASHKSGCTAKSSDGPINSLGIGSRVRVQVEDDMNEPVKAGKALNIEVGSVKASIPPDSTGVSIDWRGEGLAGALVSAIDSDDKLICKTTIPAVAELPEDAARRSLRVGIGASFRFASGLSPSNLYSDATAFIPDLWHPRWLGSRSVGIDAGFYNGTTTDHESPRLASLSYYAPVPGDTLYWRISRYYSSRRKTSDESVGFYFGVTARLANGVFFVTQFESLRRDAEDVDSLKASAIYDSVKTTLPSGATAATPPGGLPGDTAMIRRSAAMLFTPANGLLISIQRNSVVVRLKVMYYVWVDPLTGSKQGVGTEFRMTDFANGFKLGANARWFGGDKSEVLPTSILVFLAKDLRFERLGSFLAGNGEK